MIGRHRGGGKGRTGRKQRIRCIIGNHWRSRRGQLSDARDARKSFFEEKSGISAGFVRKNSVPVGQWWELNLRVLTDRELDILLQRTQIEQEYRIRCWGQGIRERNDMMYRGTAENPRGAKIPTHHKRRTA